MSETQSTGKNFPRVGSAAIIVNSKGEVLLGKRAKQPAFGEWVLPGGKIEPFETIEAAVKREAKEELGLQVEVVKRLGTYELIDAENHRIIFYSFAKPTPDVQTITCSDDTSEARYFKKEELLALPLSNLIKQVLGDAGFLTSSQLVATEGVHVKVKIAPGNEDLQLPNYATLGAAAADVRAAVKEETTIQPGKRMLIPTGLHLEIPEGYEIQVRPRSGLALKHGITFPNTPGTIDSDYRGELGIIMHNLGHEPFTIKRGDRIAQLVLAPVTKAIFRQVDVLSDSNRGTGGFGSSGRN